MLSNMADLLSQPCGLLEAHAQGGFMDSLPDPMKLEWQTTLFVMLLVALLYIFLKAAFFKPVMAVMDDREAAIAAGASAKAEAAARVEFSQAKYAEALKELRAKAFEHRKALAAEVAKEKQALLDESREQSAAKRQTALRDLRDKRETAKVQLLAQVDTFSEAMVRQLLKQA